MSVVAIGPEDTAKALWPKKDAPHQRHTRDGDGVVAGIHRDGSVLHLHLEGKPVHMTCLVMHPLVELCCALGTSDGRVYVVHLAENRLWLAADVGEPIHDVVFCGSPRCDVLAVLLASGEVWLVQYVTGRVEQRILSPGGVHAQHHHHHRRRGGLAVSGPTGAHGCGGGVLAVWCGEYLSIFMERETSSATTTGAPRFASLGFIFPSSAVPRGTPTCGGAAAHVVALCVEANAIVALMSGGVMAEWRYSHEPHKRTPPPPTTTRCGSHPLELITAVQLPHTMSNADVLATHANLVAVGGTNATEVALFQRSDWHGAATVVELCTSASTHKMKDRLSSLCFVASQLILCCGMQSGRTIILETRTRTKLFDIPPPQHVGGVGVGVGVGATPRRWRFVASGPTVGVVWCSQKMMAIHLPTARQAFTETNNTEGGGGAPTSKTMELLCSFLRPAHVANTKTIVHDDDGDDDVADVIGRGAINNNNSKRFPRDALKLDDRVVMHEWPDVGRLAHGGGLPSTTTRTAKTSAAQQQQQRHRRGGSDADAIGQSLRTQAMFSDGLSAASCQHNMMKLRDHLTRYGVFPSLYRGIIWRFVLELPNPRRTAAQYAALARRPTHASVANWMRPFPLPTTTTTTTTTSSSSSSLRKRMEATLSALAWHAPIITTAAYLPALIYPLAHVFGEKDDAQSLLEVALMFVLNWCSFRYAADQPPAELFTYLHFHILRREDVELFEHMKRLGALEATWPWEVMMALYSDLLSAAEWLRMMDHAVMMEPIWFFIFYLALLMHHRQRLLRCGSPEEVEACVRRRNDDDDDDDGGGMCMAKVLAATHRLYALVMAEDEMEEGELVRAYRRWRGFGPRMAYPTNFSCDAEEVAERLCLLDAAQRATTEELEAKERLAHLRREADVEALRGEVRAHHARARVAAKYTMTQDGWRSRVAMEQVRQEQEAKERQLRLEMLHTRIQQEERLAHVEVGRDEIEQQLRHAAVDHLGESEKWHMSRELAEVEMQRRERETQERIASAILMAQHQQHQQHQHQHASPFSSSIPEVAHVGTSTLPPSLLCGRGIQTCQRECGAWTEAPPTTDAATATAEMVEAATMPVNVVSRTITTTTTTTTAAAAAAGGGEDDMMNDDAHDDVVGEVGVVMDEAMEMKPAPSSSSPPTTSAMMMMDPALREMMRAQYGGAHVPQDAARSGPPPSQPRLYDNLFPSHPAQEQPSQPQQHHAEHAPPPLQHHQHGTHHDPYLYAGVQAGRPPRVLPLHQQQHPLRMKQRHHQHHPQQHQQQQPHLVRRRVPPTSTTTMSSTTTSSNVDGHGIFDDSSLPTPTTTTTGSSRSSSISTHDVLRRQRDVCYATAPR